MPRYQSRKRSAAAASSATIPAASPRSPRWRSGPPPRGRRRARRSPWRRGRGRSPTRGRAARRAAWASGRRRSPRTSSPRAGRARSRPGDAVGAAVDEREVEPVADPEPVEARVGEGEGLLRSAAAVDVEDAAALGVGERATPFSAASRGERGRRLAAPSQDHERDPGAAARRGLGRPRGRASARARPRPGSPASSSAGGGRRRRARSPSRAPRRPSRRTAVFRLLSSWPATSRATFGRASKFAPTTPIGIRRSLTRARSAASTLPISRSSGGISATSPRPGRRSASTRASSRRSRSRSPRRAVGRRLDVGVVGCEDRRRSARPTSARRSHAAAPSARRSSVKRLHGLDALGARVGLGL